jgi:drug/metabolite transporter (DMT)-like permease
MLVTAPPQSTLPAPPKHSTTLGVLCGVGAALCWALGFVAARHGVDAGLSPSVMALHRFVWPALALSPFLFADGFADFGGVGWRRAAVLTIFGGLPFSLLSYVGYLFVPLGHAGVIQPSCAALGGLLLAWLVLKEPLPPRRIVGALVIVLGLCTIGVEALRTMGGHGIGGDLLFATAGTFFGTFGMLLRLWRVPAMKAAAVTSVLSLVGLPILLFKFDNMVAIGFSENLLQAVVQGLLAGAGGTYFFARAVILLGAARAALFPSLVPPFTLFIGLVALHEVPSVSQLVGLVLVVAGFRLTQKA